MMLELNQWLRVCDTKHNQSCNSREQQTNTQYDYFGNYDAGVQICSQFGNETRRKLQPTRAISTYLFFDVLRIRKRVPVELQTHKCNLLVNYNTSKTRITNNYNLLVVYHILITKFTKQCCNLHVLYNTYIVIYKFFVNITVLILQIAILFVIFGVVLYTVSK